MPEMAIFGVLKENPMISGKLPFLNLQFLLKKIDFSESIEGENIQDTSHSVTSRSTSAYK